jgi:hypothetical protein
MPNPQSKMKLLLATLVLLAITSLACSSDSGPKPATEPNSAVGNYETCTGFISFDSIADLTGVEGLFERVSVTDVAAVPELAESGTIDSCLVEIFQSVDESDNPVPGESLTLFLVRFENSELAQEQYNSTLASALIGKEQLGELAVLQQDVVGTNSYLMDVSASGIGALVVFAFNSTFVSISSTADDESNALFDGHNLVNTAQSVQSRLP